MSDPRAWRTMNSNLKNFQSTFFQPEADTRQLQKACRTSRFCGSHLNRCAVHRLSMSPKLMTKAFFTYSGMSDARLVNIDVMCRAETQNRIRYKSKQWSPADATSRERGKASIGDSSVNALNSFLQGSDWTAVYPPTVLRVEDLRTNV